MSKVSKVGTYKGLEIFVEPYNHMSEKPHDDYLREPRKSDNHHVSKPELKFNNLNLEKGD